MLGLQNQRLDFAERGIFAGLGNSDIESAGEVVCAREDLHTGDLVSGQRFTGDCGLVDGA